MRMHPLLFAPLALAACQSPSGAGKADAAAFVEEAGIAKAVTLDYRTRYEPKACLATATTARNGPEDIPHDLAQRTITWTYLARTDSGMYEAVDPGTGAAIDAVWKELRGGKYPSITLPADAMPPKPVGGCGKTLTLTSPMIAGVNAFVRWSDGTSRRTMALRKDKDGWKVVAEGPAKIG